MNDELQDISLEHWKRIVDEDIRGVVYGCHCVYPVMVRQGYGHIVNTASLAGLISGGLTTPYSAGKHAADDAPAARFVEKFRKNMEKAECLGD